MCGYLTWNTRHFTVPLGRSTAEVVGFEITNVTVFTEDT
jgi:hypothetical protein